MRASRCWLLLPLLGCSSGDVGPIDRGPPEPDLVPRLHALPHVLEVRERAADSRETSVPEGFREIDIDFDQLVDHDRQDGPHFTQRVRIWHAHSGRAVILSSSGYDLRASTPTELADGFSMNEIDVEHRYFGSSRPESDAAYAFLDARQAAFDFHEIADALKRVYTGTWIGAGASKGGETALFHRLHFPDDTTATIAYVTPLVVAEQDARFPQFLASVGGDARAECRTRLREFQRTVLTRRDEIAPR